jgi:hypothetical protein
MFYSGSADQQCFIQDPRIRNVFSWIHESGLHRAYYYLLGQNNLCSELATWRLRPNTLHLKIKNGSCQDMLRFLHTTILTMCTAKMFKFGGKGRP